MTAAPVRLQLSRRKGFDLQALSRAANGLEAVNVARPSKWGNPFVAGENYKTVMGTTRLVRDVEHAVSLFRAIADCKVEEIREELRGKNLACWCRAGKPCHADVLLKVANR